MAYPRLPMRKIKEVLRLKHAGLSERQIARSCDTARSTIAVYLARAAEADAESQRDTAVAAERQATEQRNRARAAEEQARLDRDKAIAAAQNR